MTKLSDLGLPITETRHAGQPEQKKKYFVPCPACGQAIDLLDPRQVIWHQRPGHEPLELDS